MPSCVQAPFPAAHYAGGDRVGLPRSRHGGWVRLRVREAPRALLLVRLRHGLDRLGHRAPAFLARALAANSEAFFMAAISSGLVLKRS